MSSTVADSVNRLAAASIRVSIPSGARGVHQLLLGLARCRAAEVRARAAATAEAPRSPRRRGARGGRVGKKPSTCASSAVVISMPAITAGPPGMRGGGRHDGAHVARAVVVTDGDHRQPLARGLRARWRAASCRATRRERAPCGCAGPRRGASFSARRLAPSRRRRPSAYSRPAASNVDSGVARRGSPSCTAFSAHRLLGPHARGEHHRGQARVQGHGDHVHVHLDRQEQPAGGRVGQHVAEQVRGVRPRRPPLRPRRKARA